MCHDISLAWTGKLIYIYILSSDEQLVWYSLLVYPNLFTRFHQAKWYKWDWKLEMWWNGLDIQIEKSLNGLDYKLYILMVVDSKGDWVEYVNLI